MAGGQRIDPYLNFRFRVEIEGIQQAGFMECTGLGSQIEVVEYREGGEVASVRKLPGKVSYPDITLKWGITDSQELYQWHLQVIHGNLVRKNGSVVLLDSQGNEKLRWNFFSAWPSKWTIPQVRRKADRSSGPPVTWRPSRRPAGPARLARPPMFMPWGRHLGIDAVPLAGARPHHFRLLNSTLLGGSNTSRTDGGAYFPSK